MELEDLIKKYPDGIHHKPTHAECVKLESFLGSTNLSKLKVRLPKLAPFLVSSILNSDEPTMAIAVTNIRACVPYLQEHLQALILQELTTIQGNMKGHLEKLGNPARALLVWRTVVYVLGPVLHKNRTAVNTLLIIPEKAFKSSTPVVQKNAFLSWRELVDNFALNPDVISHAKRLKLILQPMMSNKSKTEEVQLARATTWWHIAVKLQDKLNAEFDKVCIPLLRFVFQISSESGKISNSSPEVGSQYSQALLLKGSEILLRILEVPGQNLPSGLTSPKKLPTFTAAPLTFPISHLSIAKNASLILELMKKSLNFLNTLQPGCPLAQTLVQMLLLRMNFLSKEEGKVEVEAVAEFIQFIHVCIKENLVSSALKLIDRVTRLLSSKVLTSHCYHVAANSTEVMNGVPALGFLDMLLSDSFFLKEKSSDKFATVVTRLVNAGIEETSFYLPFAQKILDRLKILGTKEGNTTDGSIDVVVTLWTHTSSALYRKIQKTQEVNQGDSLEHNFSCLLAALVLPMKLQLASSKSIQSKEVEKNWSNLCKAFLKCAALVNNTDVNVACEELCSQMLTLLKEEVNPELRILDWVSYTCGTLLGCINFESVNTMQKAASILQSPERWRKRQQQPLGNITSFVELLGQCLSSCFQLIKKGVSAESSVTPCLQHSKTLFSSITVSSSLVSLVVQFGPSLVDFYRKPSDAKKFTPFSKLLEQTWLSIVSAFLVHYKGPHSQDTFNALCPLLEPTLLHSNKSIHEKARSLWFSAFSDIYNSLNFPESFKTVLKEVRPALIPGSQISSADSMMSFEQPVEEKETQRTPSTRRKGPVAEIQDSSKKENSATPKSNKKGTSRKDKSSVEVITDDEGFVVIPPTSKTTKRVLTDHQKEIMKQKSTIPAMYSDLTQETQLTQDSASLPIVVNNSESDSVVPIDVPAEIPETEPSAIPDTPMIDLISSGSTTILNSASATVDLESGSSSPEKIVEESDQTEPELLTQTPEHTSDDSQLSGTDSPIILPCGVSSKDVRLPRIVKRDIKLKEPTSVYVVRVSKEELKKLAPDSGASSDSSDVSGKETRRSRRNASKRTIEESSLPSDLKDKESAVKSRVETIELSPKKVDSEPSTPSKKRNKEVVESPRKVSPEKKGKTVKRKRQTVDDSPKKKVKPTESTNTTSDNTEDVIPVADEDCVSLDSNSKQSESSDKLLTEIGEKAASSDLEVCEVTSKATEVVDIEDSEVEAISNEVEQQLDEGENQEGMEVDFVPEGQEIEQFNMEDENEEEPVVCEDDFVSNDADTIEEEINEEVDEEIIHDEDADKENIPTEPSEDVAENEELFSEEQVEDDGILDENESKHDSPNETSQSNSEFLTEEPKVIETSNGSKKRKTTSPVKSATNRTTVTVGFTSRWKVKDSGTKRVTRSVDKSVDNEQNLESVLDEDSVRNERENASIIANDPKAAVESPVSSVTGKAKPSPVSSKRKPLCGTSSPLSRSHLMVEAAMKNRAAEVDPVSPKTVKDVHSASAKKSLHVFSPIASPSTGILKSKPGSPPGGQKRRVSFADPPVHPVSEVTNSVTESRDLQKNNLLTPIDEREKEDQMVEVKLEADLNQDSPVYPDLVGCADSVQEILPQLTSSLWSRGLDKLLRSKNISTVGDLAQLTCSAVQSLPIIKPKVKTLRTALAKHFQKQGKKHAEAEAKEQSTLLLKENEDEQVAGMRDVDSEIPFGDSETDFTQEDAADASQESVSGTQELMITQVPSHDPSSLQDEDEEEGIQIKVEPSAHSPPLASMEDALNDKDILNSSMLEANSGFSSVVEHAGGTLGQGGKKDFTKITPVVVISRLSSESERLSSLIGSRKDQFPAEPVSSKTKMEEFLRECTVEELLDAIAISQELLRNKVL